MKFLQEMIAKKRQAQEKDELDGAPGADGGDQGFVLPELSAVSDEAVDLGKRPARETTASVIPIRQPEDSADGGRPAFVQAEEDLDWDLAEIDLSDERAAAAEADAPAKEAPAPAADPLDAIRSEFAEAPQAEFEPPAPDDPEKGLLRLAGRDEAEASDDADPPVAASELAGGADGWSEDQATAEELMPELEAEEPAAAEAAPETVAERDAEAETAPESADAGKPKTAAEAAAALAEKFQQRKIWDIQPADAAADETAADAEPEPVAEAASETEAEPEPAPEPVAEIDSDPADEVAEEAPAEDDPLARMPIPPMQPSSDAPSTPLSRLRAETDPAPAAEIPGVEALEPAPEAPAAEATGENEVDLDDDLPPIEAPRRRPGRVKTRLLGFHKPDATVDPITAATEAPKSEAAFPVGWLVVTGGPGRGASFTLTEGASKIGRGEDQAVRLDFGDTSISRDNHAVVAYDIEQKRFFMGHGGKANLVRLNDMPVLSTEPLEDGDLIRIGETTLRFVALCGPDFSWQEDGADGTDANAI